MVTLADATADARRLLGDQGVVLEEGPYFFVENAVRAYVHAGSAPLPDELLRVVLFAYGRLIGNPELERQESIGDYSVTHGAPFTGWTLPELVILNRHRRRAL